MNNLTKVLYLIAFVTGILATGSLKNKTGDALEEIKDAFGSIAEKANSVLAPIINATETTFEEIKDASETAFADFKNATEHIFENVFGHHRNDTLPQPQNDDNSTDATTKPKIGEKIKQVSLKFKDKFNDWKSKVTNSTKEIGKKAKDALEKIIKPKKGKKTTSAEISSYYPTPSTSSFPTIPVDEDYYELTLTATTMSRTTETTTTSNPSP